jgi:uroporphyrinogen decarboxylase
MLHLHGNQVHPGLFQNPSGVMLHYDASLGNPAPEAMLSERRPVSTGPAPALLASGAPVTAVESECEAILSACKGQGFILSPGCSTPLAVTAERVRAVIAAARRPRPDRSAV